MHFVEAWSDSIVTQFGAVPVVVGVVLITIAIAWWWTS